MSQELVTYIVLGSYERLKDLKLPVSTKKEEYLLTNFLDDSCFEDVIDKLIFKAKRNIVVLLPPSSFPNSKSKKILMKISSIDHSSWGWFQFNEKRNDFIQNLKK